MTEADDLEDKLLRLLAAGPEAKRVASAILDGVVDVPVPTLIAALAIANGRALGTLARAPVDRDRAAFAGSARALTKTIAEWLEDVVHAASK